MCEKIIPEKKVYAFVKNWSEFQHYKKRNPPWIKLHRELLDNFEFSRLSLASRALAPLIWLLASNSEDGRVRIDIEFLSFRLRWNKNEIETGLGGLLENGWLTIASDAQSQCYQNASKTLAGRLHDVLPEKEAKTETDKQSEGERDSNSKTRNEVEKADLLGESVNDVMSFGNGISLPRPVTANSITKTLSIIKSRLKEGYTTDQLKNHLAIFVEKKQAHKRYQAEYGEDPPINSQIWCPRITWRIADILSPERLDKYYSAWAEEGFVTAEEMLAANKAKKIINFRRKNWHEPKSKGYKSDGRPYPIDAVY